MAKEDFKESLEEYLVRVERANSEAALGFQFLDFIQRTFDTLDSGRANQLFPFLEEYVQSEDATVAISGRIDARLGNVLIEFKTDLERDLGDAEEQLKRYITAIWNETGREQKYYLIASDGITCIVYIPELSGNKITTDNVQLQEVDKIHLNEDDEEYVFVQLDRYLLYSEEIRPTTENFVRDFGPDSPVFSESIELLHEEWGSVESTSAAILHEEWKRYLEIVHGSSGDESLRLFLRHTYLSTIAKLMAYIQYSEGRLPKNEEIDDIIQGDVFEQWGIQNFAEEDFFSWISREEADGVDVRLSDIILSRLRDYDIHSISEDVLKELYQNLVTQEERHDLGEYYTPDWLVGEIVQTELTDNPELSLLDPACGSGTFLFRSIRYKQEKLDKDGQDFLDHVQNKVVGIDVHPLAVIISRVNYLLAVGDDLRKKEREFQVPIYLANSIKPPTYELSTETTVEVYRFQPEGIDANFEVPVAITEDNGSGGNILNNVLDSIDSYIRDIEKDDFNTDDLDSYLSTQLGEMYERLTDQEKSILLNNIGKEIYELKKEGRDTIWSFILKNVYKPIFLEEQKFDRILGNPPWLSYRFINRTDYQDHVRNLISNEYNLIESGDIANFTQIELASLFFAYASDHYLKGTESEQTGRIAFVMPRSVFNGNHLYQFRKGEFITEIHFTELWDFGDVQNLFNNLTCVLKAEKSSGDSYPLPGRSYSGEVSNISALRIDELSLNSENTIYHHNELGDRTVITDREIDPEMFEGTSPYKDRIYEGATIVPRPLWFVEFEEHPRLGINPSAPKVKTSERARSRAKSRWSEVTNDGQIEPSFLYYVVTGSEMVYFDTLDLPIAVLPIEHTGNRFTLIDSNNAQRKGYNHLQEWLSNANKKWERNKKESSNLSLLERLNYRDDLTRQKPNKRYRVLQNHSGAYVHGAVIDLAQIEPPNVSGTQIEIQRNKDGHIPVVVDAKCYYYETDDVNEAYYLSGFLNSPTILELIQDMMSRGLFGRRDVHKNVWEVTIPEFDPDNRLHQRISEAAREGEQKAQSLLPDLLSQYAQPLSYAALGQVRSNQREQMESIRSELSELCINALESGSTQSSLGDH